MAVWCFEWISGGTAKIPPDLAQRWDAAFEERGNIWQCREFILAWENVVAPRRQETPILLFAHDDLGHEIVYPLFYHAVRRFGLRRTEVTPLGGVYYCDYQDPLSIGRPMEARDFQKFWREFERAFETTLWRRFGPLSRVRAFRLHLPPRDQASRTSEVAPYIRLSDFASFDELLASRGQNLRSNLKRKLGRVRQLGCDDLTFVTSSEIQTTMSAFCANYLLQWGRDGQITNLDVPGTREFWTALALSASRLGKLHFSTLNVGGETWHWHLGFQHRDSILWYKPTYNVAFSNYSPGLVHLAMLVRDAINRGVESVDLGYGSEPYKYQWTEDHCPLFSMQIERYKRVFSVVRFLHGTRRRRSARTPAGRQLSTGML
jgi:CelD/BcsL family acetyltransferase involved in cellulose biosynthesis